MLKVSVCIPTYKSCYLAKTLSSVLSQTFTDFEVIVVDDSFKDDARRVTDTYQDKRLRYYRNAANIGMVANWNRCVELAQGEYIAILHDDDLWRKDYLARAVTVLEGNRDVGFVCSAVDIIDGSGDVQSIHRPWGQDRIISGEAAFKELIFSNKIRCPSVMVRRQCYGRVGVFDHSIKYAADWEMWMRLCLYWDLGYIAEPLASYRVHQSSLTNQMAAQSAQREFFFKDEQRVCERAIHAAREARAPELGKMARTRLAAMHLRTAGKNRKRGIPSASYQDIRRALAICPSMAISRIHVILIVMLGAMLYRNFQPTFLGRMLEYVGRPIQKFRKW